MTLAERQVAMQRIRDLRGGRNLICFFNFDRNGSPPVPGLTTQFAADTKEALYRVLKESVAEGSQIDLCLYTRGGDTNSVWPLVSLVREFDPDFQVLVPFRCHSAGTLVALGASKIMMTRLGELSPIDPSTGNQFNPVDPADKQSRLAISVEDVKAYRDFVLEQYRIKTDEKSSSWNHLLEPMLAKLAQDVHPLALGNVHRVHQQIMQLAASLLKLHPISEKDASRIVETLATRFYSHLHMINRNEARSILGDDKVEAAKPELESALDGLLRMYEDTFKLREEFFLNAYLEDKARADARFIGGVLESVSWAYIFETRLIFSQNSRIPPNVQVQLPPTEGMPLIPGLPRERHWEVVGRGWVHNKEPRGFTA